MWDATQIRRGDALPDEKTGPRPNWANGPVLQQNEASYVFSAFAPLYST